MPKPLIDLTVIQGGNVTAPHPESVHADPAPPAQSAQAAPPVGKDTAAAQDDATANATAMPMTTPHPDSAHAAPSQARR